MSRFIRIKKECFIELPDGMSYEEALTHGGWLDQAGGLEYDLFVDVVEANGTLVNAAMETQP